MDFRSVSPGNVVPDSGVLELNVTARPLPLGLASRGIFQTFREKFAFGRVKENHHPTVKKDLPKKCSNTAGLNCGMV